MKCPIFKSTKFRDISVNTCRPVCIESINQAAAEGRTTNYGCVGHFPLDQELDWQPWVDGDMEKLHVRGRCSCDNMFINMLADTVIEALPVIAQIGCFIVMSSIKLVADIGLQFIPGAGKILDSGLDAVTTAAQLLSYAYPPGEDPAGAFEWWLSPCGDTSLVPEEIRRVFDILSTVAGGVSSFREPKNIGKHSSKKGDSTNPTDRSKPKAGNGSGVNGLGNGGGVQKKRKCRVPPAKSTMIQGRLLNTLMSQSCVAAGGGTSTTMKEVKVVTSVVFGPTPTIVELTCKKEWGQACYAISSAVAHNNQWAAIPCVNGKSKQDEDSRPGLAEYYRQHVGSWRDATNRKEPECDVDEFPPRYLLDDNSVEMTNVGKKGGQVMRYMPHGVNRASGSAMWPGSCIRPMLEDYNVAEFTRRWNAGSNKTPKGGINTNHLEGTINVDFKPSISVKHEVNAPPDYGLPDNPCWPSNIAVGDPGFDLYTNDDWYSRNQRSPRWQYNQPYVKGSNGD